MYSPSAAEGPKADGYSPKSRVANSEQPHAGRPATFCSRSDDYGTQSDDRKIEYNNYIRIRFSGSNFTSASSSFAFLIDRQRNLPGNKPLIVSDSFHQKQKKDRYLLAPNPFPRLPI